MTTIKIETSLVVTVTKMSAPMIQKISKLPGVERAVRENSSTMRLVVAAGFEPGNVRHNVALVIEEAPTRFNPVPAPRVVQTFVTSKGLVGTLVHRRVVPRINGCRPEAKLTLKLDNGKLVEEWERKCDRLFETA